jgi:hypothetical protein
MGRRRRGSSPREGTYSSATPVRWCSSEGDGGSNGSESSSEVRHFLMTCTQARKGDEMSHPL